VVHDSGYLPKNNETTSIVLPKISFYVHLGMGGAVELFCTCFCPTILETRLGVNAHGITVDLASAAEESIPLVGSNISLLSDMAEFVRASGCK